MAKEKSAGEKPALAPKQGPGVCFTIMPFGGWEDNYYDSVYRPAIQDAGLRPHRADDLFAPSVIVKDIWTYTKRARVLLAILCGRNPNVFYELGLAHALAKPVVMVTESIDDVPFDLRSLRIITFKKNEPDWGTRLRGKIGSALKEVLARPAEAVLPAFLDIADAGAKLSVTAQEKQIAELAHDVDALRAEVRSTARLPYDGTGHLLDEAREMFSTGFSKSDVIADLKRRYGVSDAKAMEVTLYAAHLAGRRSDSS